MSFKFVTDGNFINLIEDEEVSFSYSADEAFKYEHTLYSLHNTSKCIDWSLPEDTTLITFTIDEQKFENIPLSTIYFDGVVSSTQAGFISSLQAMFTNLAGGSLGYSVYVAVLNQTGTNAPVATVLQNTLGGTVVWSRDSEGNYFGTLSGAFSFDKTVIFVGTPGSTAQSYVAYVNDANSIYLETASNAQNGGSDGDGLLSNTSIEVKVYP
jgi:hypothetical protein